MSRNFFLIRSHTPMATQMQECVRKPNYVYMFSGSKYQKRIDVGKCVGQCVQSPNSTLGKWTVLLASFILVIKCTAFVHGYIHTCHNYLYLCGNKLYAHFSYLPHAECVATRHKSIAIEGPNG